MERCRRLVLWFIAAILAVPLLLKGHGEPRYGEPVAFAHYSTPMAMVRLRGDTVVSGVYRFSDGVDVATVINMTAPAVAARIANKSIMATRLQSGVILEIMPHGHQWSEIRITGMQAGEKMLLGIPLHPDSMDATDWDCLPGIGPALAQRIVSDRQKNGVFGTLQAVERVPGVGKGKIERIKFFFSNAN